VCMRVCACGGYRWGVEVLQAWSWCRCRCSHARGAMEGRRGAGRAGQATAPIYANYLAACHIIRLLRHDHPAGLEVHVTPLRPSFFTACGFHMSGHDVLGCASASGAMPDIIPLLPTPPSTHERSSVRLWFPPGQADEACCFGDM
jgi:hypothetical protein